MECINCSICGEKLDEGYAHKLKCGHEFHYECLLLSFKTLQKKACVIILDGSILEGSIFCLLKLQKSIFSLELFVTYK